MNDSGMIVAPGNMEQQMKNCYSDLEKILQHYGYTVDDVVAENIYTTNMAVFIKVSGFRNSIFPPRPNRQVICLGNQTAYVVTLYWRSVFGRRMAAG